MGFFPFSKNIVKRSSLNTAEARQRFTDVIESKYRPDEMTQLINEGYNVELKINDLDFFTRITYKPGSVFERRGIHSYIKGKIFPAKSGSGSILKMKYYLSTQWIIFLVVAYLAFFALLVYAIVNKKTEPMIVSLALIILWYVGLLFASNEMVGKYNKFLNGCFGDRKYRFSHLS